MMPRVLANKAAKMDLPFTEVQITEEQVLGEMVQSSILNMSCVTTFK